MLANGLAAKSSNRLADRPTNTSTNVFTSIIDKMSANVLANRMTIHGLGTTWGQREVNVGQLVIMLGSNLHHVWGQLGISLGSFWDHVGIICGSVWNDFGIMLGLVWDHL